MSKRETARGQGPDFFQRGTGDRAPALLLPKHYGPVVGGARNAPPTQRRPRGTSAEAFNGKAIGVNGTGRLRLYPGAYQQYQGLEQHLCLHAGQNTKNSRDDKAKRQPYSCWPPRRARAHYRSGIRQNAAISELAALSRDAATRNDLPGFGLRGVA